MLVLKGWAMDVHELEMVRPLILPFLGLGVLLGALIAGLLRLLVGRAIGPVAASLIASAGPAILALLLAVGTRSSWLEFFRPRRTGHLLVIDPDSLRVRQQISPPERCAYARTALVPIDRRDEMNSDLPRSTPPDEWLVIVGDERIMRWRYHEGRLTYDPTWTESYRSWGDGSFPGTGPCVYRHVVYYTDNTFPVGLKGGYRLYP